MTKLLLGTRRGIEIVLRLSWYKINPVFGPPHDSVQGVVVASATSEHEPQIKAALDAGTAF